MTAAGDNKKDELEINLAHQAEALESLSQVVEKQWQEIDALTRNMLRMNDRLIELENGDGSSGAIENTPPPHY